MTEGTAGCSAFDDAKTAFCAEYVTLKGAEEVAQVEAPDGEATVSATRASLGAAGRLPQPHLPIDMRGNPATAPPFPIKQRS